MRGHVALTPIQADIMRQLFARESLRFAQINHNQVPSDQFSYHLRQLQKHELIQKDEDGAYKLSVQGRSHAILMDTESNQSISQGFVAVRVVLTKQENNQTKHLVQKRTRVPYMGYLGEPGGKVLFGEDVPAAATRNMLSETGLTCDITLCGLVHYRDIYKDELVQDKYFFVAKATNPTGTLKVHGPAGDNLWLTRQQIMDSTFHQGLPEILDMAEGPPFQFHEQLFYVEDY